MSAILAIIQHTKTNEYYIQLPAYTYSPTNSHTHTHTYTHIHINTYTFVETDASYSEKSALKICVVALLWFIHVKFTCTTLSQCWKLHIKSVSYTIWAVFCDTPLFVKSFKTFWRMLHFITQTNKLVKARSGHHKRVLTNNNLSAKLDNYLLYASFFKWQWF